MAASDLDVIKDIPGFKVILKTVLKAQIQQLVEQLVAHTDEESVILTASVSDGTISHLGSDFGKGFLEEQENIKTQFLSFCLKRHHQKLQEEKESQRQTTLAAQAPLAGQSDYGTGPRRNTRMPYHTSPRQAVFPKGGFNVRSQRHEPYPILRPDRRTSFTESGQGSLSSPAGENVAVKTELSDTDNQEGNDSVNRDDDNTYSSFGASEQSGSKAGENIEDSSEIDAKVVKVEAVSDSDFELENTGVEPGQSVHPDNLDLNVSVGMNFNQSQGISGSMTDADDQHNLDCSLNLTRSENPKQQNIRKRFKCDRCGKSFSSMALVSFHVKNLHEKSTRQSICFICNKRFSTVFNMKRHQEIVHLNRRPHECSVCQKGFSCQRDLVEHMRQSHNTGEKYQCNKCEKQFGYKKSIDRHKMVCGKRPKDIECGQCSKRFKSKGALDNHVRAKHGKRAVICEYCGKNFDWKSSHRRHLQTVHKDVNTNNC